MKNKIANLLVFLMQSGGKKCPPKHFFPVNERKLLVIAIRNKAAPFLFHFLDCPSCGKKLTKKTIKKLSRYQKSALIWPLFYQKEKQRLGRFCHKRKIKGVLLKDFSSYPKMKYHHRYLMGADIDILVKKNDLLKIESFLKERGYQLKIHTNLRDSRGKIHYQEKNFAHPQKHVAVDLHPQLAIPHDDEFRFLSWEIIEKASVEIFQNLNYQKQSGFYIPKAEYFLFSLIIHYLGSGLLKGLRNLLDIIQFAHLYNKEIDWKKFLALTRRFKVTNPSLFILLLGSQIFDLPFPQGLKRNIRIPLRVKFLAPYYSVEKIALFPPVDKWNIKNKEAKKIFYENFFLKLFLVDSISYWRLIRPRVFLFILKVGLSWPNKFASRLYHKSPLLKHSQHQFQGVE